MKVITKKISYNDYWSKIPGVIPSLTNYWYISDIYANCSNTEVTKNKIYSHERALNAIEQYNIPYSDLFYAAEFVNYDFNTLKTFSNGNFHHIPSDIVIPDGIAEKITDYTDLYVNIPKGENDFYDLNNSESEDEGEGYHYEFTDGRWRIIKKNGKEIKIITFATFTKWYTFFTEYSKLLFNAEYNMTFSSATQSYTYLNDNIIEDEVSRLTELDDLYQSRGGDDMYQWMNEHCIVKFKIPEKYAKNWGNDYLYYSEAVKWYTLFKEQYINENGECRETPKDCCVAKQYEDKGGCEFYQELEAWLKDIDLTDVDYALNSASITIPVTLSTTIDDLGEMSIFSDRWDMNTKYETGSVYYQPFDVKEGKINVEDDFFISSGGGNNGVLECGDFEFKDGSLYLPEYKNLNPNEFGEQYSAYTYSPIDGKMTYLTDDDSVTFTKSYDVVYKDFIVINSTMQDVIDGSYVTLTNEISDRSMSNIQFINNDKLPIISGGGVPYCEYNGVKYYVENYNNKDVVRFLKSVIGDADDGCEITDGQRYVMYTKKLHLVDDNKVIITDDDGYEVEYEVLNGYFTINDRTFYIKNIDNSYTPVLPEISGDIEEGGKGVVYEYKPIDGDKLEELGLENIYINNDKVDTTFKKPEKIQMNVVSGFSESKLELLRRPEITTDDLGNELPGHFNFFEGKTRSEFSGTASYNTVYEGAMLDILYKVGTVSELVKTSEENEFHGNYLENIELYYVNPDETFVIDSDGEPCKIEIGNNETIQQAVDRLNEIQVPIDTVDCNGDDIIIDVSVADRVETNRYQMMMDVTYYIGCTVRVNENGEYERIDDKLGVKYMDSISISKEVGTFYTEFEEPFLFNYYALKPYTKKVYNSTFRKNKIVMESRFEMERPGYGKDYDEGDKFYLGDNGYNNLSVSPLFRQEWDMFSTTPQIINNDIYIDRGINSAFEKHLRLQEVRTMEALETYGISYFKIENS